MSALDKRGGLDRKILEAAAAGLSPEENSERLGGILSASKIAIRVKELISSPDDYLTIPEQMRLNLRMMRETLSDIQERYLDVDHAKLRLAYMKEISATLERLQKTNEQDINTYNASVGRAMARTFDIAVAHIFGALGDRVTPEEAANLKRAALEMAQAEVARQQVEA